MVRGGFYLRGPPTERGDSRATSSGERSTSKIPTSIYWRGKYNHHLEKKTLMEKTSRHKDLLIECWVKWQKFKELKLPQFQPGLYGRIDMTKVSSICRLGSIFEYVSWSVVQIRWLDGRFIVGRLSSSVEVWLQWYNKGLFTVDPQRLVAVKHLPKLSITIRIHNF